MRHPYLLLLICLAAVAMPLATSAQSEGSDFQLNEPASLHDPGALAGPLRWFVKTDQAGADFGWSVGSAGDVNGDGYDDVIVGALTYGNGRAFLYYGSPSGTSQMPDWTGEGIGDSGSRNYGQSVGTAGDINGDGYDDVIVGAPYFFHGQVDEGLVFVYYGSPSGPSVTPDWIAESNQGGATFGRSVGTAGDVNGDGYDDVIIGADFYSNGQSLEGRAFVYHGSASGLSKSPDWTAESDEEIAHFGYSVGTAGDVNHDGYADVIVGTSESALVYAYYGSASGLSKVANWTDQVDTGGLWVGTAGDVNRDGFADVIVGAYLSFGKGRSNVYYGSPSGLSASPNWSVSGDQRGADFGYSVGTAGDLNGDGYYDVIIGARYYDDGQTNEGRAFAYYGSPTGPSLQPDRMIESNQSGGSLGWSVGTAGDVNGDGYADVIIGGIGYHAPDGNGGAVLFGGRSQ